MKSHWLWPITPLLSRCFSILPSITFLWFYKAMQWDWQACGFQAPPSHPSWKSGQHLQLPGSWKLQIPKTTQKSSREALQWHKPALQADESLNGFVRVQHRSRVCKDGAVDPTRVQSQQGVDPSHSCGPAAPGTETLLVCHQWGKWRQRLQ